MYQVLVSGFLRSVGVRVTYALVARLALVALSRSNPRISTGVRPTRYAARSLSRDVEFDAKFVSKKYREIRPPR